MSDPGEIRVGDVVARYDEPGVRCRVLAVGRDGDWVHLRIITGRLAESPHALAVG